MPDEKEELEPWAKPEIYKILEIAKTPHAVALTPETTKVPESELIAPEVKEN